MKFVSLILASVFCSAAMAQTTVEISTEKVLAAFIENASQITLEGDFKGERMSDLLAGLIDNQLAQMPVGASDALVSTGSSCEMVGKTEVIQCTLYVNNEVVKKIKHGVYKKDMIGEGTAIFIGEFVRDGSGRLVLKNKNVKSIAAG